MIQPKGSLKRPFTTHNEVVEYWDKIKLTKTNYVIFKSNYPKNHKIYISNRLKNIYFKTTYNIKTENKNKNKNENENENENEKDTLIYKWIKKNNVSICHVLHKSVHPLIIEYFDRQDNELKWKFKLNCATFFFKKNKICDKTCSICLEDLNKNTQTLTCNHEFHIDCIKLLTEYHMNQCPLCRHPIDSQV